MKAFHWARAAALGGALAASLAACGDDDPQAAATEATARAAASRLAVTLAPVRTQALERGPVVSGPITAWEEMQLGVEVGGLRVTAVHADVGQQVARGQVLLELDPRSLDSELAQAEAVYAEAIAGVQLAEVNRRRGEALAREKLISAAAYDELRATLVQAQARAATTRAQRDGVRLRRSYATLRAPDAGVIARRAVQPGQVVAAGTELFALIRQGRLEWRPELAEAELARVAVGDAVRLRDATGAVVDGRVRAVSPGVDSSKRTGTVYAALDDPKALKAGAFVEGRIITDAASGRVVPADAVVVRDGYAYVFTVDDAGIAHRVRVVVGERAGAWIEILEGLREGDRVVVAGAGFLGDGDPVRVVDAAAPAAAKAGG